MPSKHADEKLAQHFIPLLSAFNDIALHSVLIIMLLQRIFASISIHSYLRQFRTFDELIKTRMNIDRQIKKSK